MKTAPWIAAGAALLLAALAPQAAQPDRKGTEAELGRVKDQIAREQRDQKKTEAERDRLNKALADAERRVNKVSGDLSSLREERAALLASRRELAGERERRQAEHDAAQAGLANQLRAAYLMGRNEPLKLLLNQRNPAEVGRNLTYYGYLGRLRVDQIGTIKTNIVRIEELTARIDEEDAKLGGVESRLRKDAGELEAEQRQRRQLRTSLERESRSRAARLRDLQAQRQQMEKLLAELTRRAEATPYDPNSPFARLKRKLNWPVAGRLASRFGANGSEGIEIDAARGATVRAVHEGVVRFADYMNNRGNMIILDHGDGYWSVYAHNEHLFKAEGARVAAGEKIATVGDTGGRARPGLYFEIRHWPTKTRSRAVDPQDWFRSSAPPSG